MAQLKAIRRFEEWKKNPEHIEVFFSHIEGTCPGGVRKRFRDAAMAMKVPYTLLYAFVHDGGELQHRYEMTLKALSDAYMQETVPIADDVKANRDDVAKAKLQIEARQAYASKLDSERYGDRPSDQKPQLSVWIMRMPTPATSTQDWVREVQGGANVYRQLPEREIIGLPITKVETPAPCRPTPKE